MRRFRLNPVRGILLPALALLCASCASPGPEPRAAPADALYAHASSAARFAYEQGEYDLARSIYLRALARARSIDNPRLAADAAYNLAVSEIALGRYAAAEPLLVEAQYDAGRSGSPVGEIILVRAKAVYLDGRVRESLTLLRELSGSKVQESLALQAVILRAQLLAELGELDAARGALEIAHSRARESDSSPAPGTRADLAKLEGTIARIEGRMADAAPRFDSEASLLREARRFRDMAFALARAAAAYREAGHPGLAADRFFLAARANAGRSDIAAAKALLASSLAEAEKAADAAAVDRARQLLKEISRPAAP